MSTTTDMTVPATIAHQLGDRTLAMLGAYHLAGTEDRLSFRFRGSRKANAVRITLNAQDTYDVEFLKIRPRKFQIDTVERIEGVYVDGLHDCIERVTGLSTRL